MNCEQIALEELHVERFQLKEVLKILLHSIIFQRALGECRLRDVDSELFDISCAASSASAEMAALADFRSRGARYVRCDSRLVEARVEEHAEAFSSAIERGARVSLAFFERRARQAAFGLFRSEERVVWERWTIPLVVVPNFAQLHRHMGGAQMPPGAHGAGRSTEADSQDEESRRRQASLEAVLRRRIEFILTVASGRREHIPPADGLGGEALWFEISTDADSWSGLDLLKQLLSSPPQLGSG
mmetsp:Transcript_36074/g.115476  ORF Transcript_36074/g.115476 Transcript_36074/m.115476 type:complete len:244 (-) Transcript_36074:297-1028(-)